MPPKLDLNNQSRAARGLDVIETDAIRPVYKRQEAILLSPKALGL